MLVRKAPLMPPSQSLTRERKSESVCSALRRGQFLHVSKHMASAKKGKMMMEKEDDKEGIRVKVCEMKNLNKSRVV